MYVYIYAYAAYPHLSIYMPSTPLSQNSCLLVETETKTRRVDLDGPLPWLKETV